MSEFNEEFDALTTELPIFYTDGQVAIQIGPGPEIDFYDDNHPQNLIAVLSPTEGLKFIGSGTRSKPQYTVEPNGSTIGYAPDGVGNFDLLATYGTDSAGKTRFYYDLYSSYGIRPALTALLQIASPPVDGSAEPFVQLSPPGCTLVASKPGSLGTGIDETWHDLTPSGSWTSAGGANPNWGVELLPLGVSPGVAFFHGALSGGTQADGTVIGTLPAGYFNTNKQALVSIGYTGSGASGPRILVNPANGQLSVFGISAATAGILLFDGLIIPAG